MNNRKGKIDKMRQREKQICNHLNNERILWPVFKEKASTTFNHVRYLRHGFDIFLNGFAYLCVPIPVSLVPSRTWWALSIPLITFPGRYFIHHLKCKIPPEKRQNLSICSLDSPHRWFQVYEQWFQIELDELYRLHYLLSSKDPPLPLKFSKNCKN